MEYRTLGSSGLHVSVLGFGAGTFGGSGPLFSAWGDTGEAEARRLVDMAIDAGINFFDTADVYSDGASERILGAALRGRRDRVVLSTKTGLRLGDGPNDAGASRHRLLRAVDDALRRLGTDYIDLLQLHAFDARWNRTSAPRAGRCRPRIARCWTPPAPSRRPTPTIRTGTGCSPNSPRRPSPPPGRARHERAPSPRTCRRRWHHDVCRRRPHPGTYPNRRSPMSTMQAVALTRYLPIDDPQSLFDCELDVPAPGPRDLLVRVEAVSVNPVDTKVRAPRPEVETQPRILGYDAAGVVEAVGAEVAGFKPGDAVYYAGDITRQGSNARFQLVDERIVARKPGSLGFAASAALPLTALTAWELLFERMGYAFEGGGDGRVLLVIAGAGGVGSVAIQLAKLAGFSVVATASREESAAWCRDLGADHVVDHRQPLAPQLQALGFEAIDVALNFADTDRYWTELGELLAPQGRVGLIVEPAGPLRIGDPYKAKCIGIHWEFMFARPKFGTADMDQQGRILARVAELVDAGRLRTTARETLSPINAANLREAHRRLESGRTVGKLVLAGW